MRYLWLPLLILLAACGGPQTVVQTATVDGVTVSFEHPPDARLLENYDLFVTLKDAQGQPIEGADVVLDMDMPDMPMGTNRPVAEAVGDGRYRVRTAYTMEGRWIITVEAEVNGQDIRAPFEQTVVPQG